MALPPPSLAWALPEPPRFITLQCYKNQPRSTGHHMQSTCKVLTRNNEQMKASRLLPGIHDPPGPGFPLHQAAQTQVPDGGCVVKTSPSPSVIPDAGRRGEEDGQELAPGQGSQQGRLPTAACSDRGCHRGGPCGLSGASRRASWRRYRWDVFKETKLACIGGPRSLNKK